ncbi:PUB57 [Symbiodinium sp. CCMP2456]|nr:PUB57 [Symbiodinium sp. CCMP2456]
MKVERSTAAAGSVILSSRKCFSFSLCRRKTLRSNQAQTELRKQKRRLQASSNRRRATSSDATTAGYILEQQCELRVCNAQKRADALQDQIRDAEKRLLEAESSLPLELGPHDEESSCHTTAGTHLHSICRDQFLSNEERLALKLATLQQFHEEIVEEAAQSQQEHDNMLRKVEQRKIQAALKQAVEPDFMCPILHERMKVPVLAADGFTYERQAIEKWLSMHNTSPMTGAVLAHRYLTENFALRHLIETYEAQLSEKRTTEGRRAGVSKTCISPPLSELSDEADSYMEEEWSNEAPSRRMVRMEEDMPILSHQVDDG